MTFSNEEIVVDSSFLAQGPSNSHSRPRLYLLSQLPTDVPMWHSGSIEKDNGDWCTELHGDVSNANIFTSHHHGKYLMCVTLRFFLLSRPEHDTVASVIGC